MFPVTSNLRRFANSVLLLRPELMFQVEGRLHIRLRRPSSVFDPRDRSWSKEVESAPMSELVIATRSPEAASISLGLTEDRLADQLNAMQTAYTLILGPEVSETQGDGSHLQRVRLCILRGVYRARGPTLEPSKPKTVISRKFSLPRGVRLEKL